MYIDSHCHLGDERFDADRAAALERARAAGVELFLEVGCAPENWDAALKLADEIPDVRCIIGLHPQEAKLMTPALFEQVSALCAQPVVVGIGETGLDYHYETSPRETQKAVFLQHIDLARSLNKPLSIHCREAYPDLFSLLAAHPGPWRGVIHCFSGTPDDAERLVAMGFHIGIDGPVSYPTAKSLRETVARIPLERILLETDCPYLPPQEFRGKRNEPAYLGLIAQAVANARGITIDEVAAAATRATRELFSL